MRRWLARELWTFLRAVTFYTRISVPPTWEAYLEERLQVAGATGAAPPLAATARYLPTVGLVVGLVVGGVYMAAAWCFGTPLAAVFAVGTAALVTGALHEDGLADAADGFGGGWTRGDVLRIMQDPRHGTYGVVTLLVALALRSLALAQLPSGSTVAVLCVSHAASRWLAMSLMASLPYARSEGKAKAAVSQLAWRDVLVAGVPAAAACLWLPQPPYVAFVLAAALVALRQSAVRYLRRRLGGYTGDCLGAVQQIAETLILLIIVARPWTYI